VTRNIENGVYVLSKNSIFLIILLTAIWIILRETLTIMTVVTGVVVGGCCVFLARRIIPLEKTERVSIFRLVIYLFFLLGQIYVGGIATIRLILFGANVEIVKIKTKIRTSLLQTVLVNSITLVPGSIALDLSKNVITVLWLTKKSEEPPDPGRADAVLKDKLERMLLKAQR